MSRSSSDAFNIVCRLDRDGKLDEASRDKKQKVATLLGLSPYEPPKLWDLSAVI